MLQSKQIKEILGNMPKNVPISVDDVHTTVRCQSTLTKQDYEPYTQTRKTDYPTWKHRVQSVLADYKKKHRVIHDEDNHTYSFV